MMLSRTRIRIKPEIQLRAQRRAGELGVSVAEYIRRLIARDLDASGERANPAAVFDLAASRGSDIARNKAAMVSEAFASERKRKRHPPQ